MTQPEQNGQASAPPASSKPRWGGPRQVADNLALTVGGSLLSALAVNGLILPQGFLSGGLTGMSVLLSYLPPGLPVSLWYLALNIPVFILGWRQVGRRFMLYSLLGAAVFTLALQLLKVQIPLHDPIVAALLAGILFGAGTGLVLRSQGSAGGLDILSVILYRRYSVRLGSTMLACNAVVLGLGAWLFPLDKVMYTLVVLFVSSRVTNLVVSGLSQRKAVLIISDHWQQIKDIIVADAHRGATLIPSHGAYSGHEANIIYTVVNMRELGRVKAMVQSVDPDAFVVVTDTVEVSGSRIPPSDHW